MRLFFITPYRRPEVLAQPFCVAFEPVQFVFLTVIAPVAQTRVWDIPARLDSLLRYRPEMMEKGAPSHGQPQTGLAGAPEKFVVLIPAQARIVVEEADALKHAARDHETDSRSHACPPD